MTTERSSYGDSSLDPMSTRDDALDNIDSLVGTREDQLSSTGLSDSPYTTGASTSTPVADGSLDDTSWANAGMPQASRDGGAEKGLTEAAGSVAGRVAGTAQEQIGARANTQLAKASDVLGQVAGAVRQGGEQVRADQPQIAGFADMAAAQVDRASTFLRDTDFNGIVREAEGFARRQPAVFLGGALALGLLASRFLKASPQRDQSDRDATYMGVEHGRA